VDSGLLRVDGVLVIHVDGVPIIRVDSVPVDSSAGCACPRGTGPMYLEQSMHAGVIVGEVSKRKTWAQSMR
jgi:hypothetical protein